MSADIISGFETIEHYDISGDTVVANVPIPVPGIAVGRKRPEERNQWRRAQILNRLHDETVRREGCMALTTSDTKLSVMIDFIRARYGAAFENAARAANFDRPDHLLRPRGRGQYKKKTIVAPRGKLPA